MTTCAAYIGFDAREAAAYAVTRTSARRWLHTSVPIRGLVLDSLREQGLYRRPTRRVDGKLWDDISQAPMATEFAISRFLVPHLAKEGLALFIDGDMLVRGSLDRLFEEADRNKAVSVVQHRHEPAPGLKMDGQQQTAYPRKNWSSLMLFNVDHPANGALTPELVNSVPGRDLHRFCWLQDRDIGELDVSWNWLAGHSDPDVAPDVVHFTDGAPFMPGYEGAPYAEEWRAALNRWAA